MSNWLWATINLCVLNRSEQRLAKNKLNPELLPASSYTVCSLRNDPDRDFGKR